jgi:hypothetical protein
VSTEPNGVRSSGVPLTAKAESRRILSGVAYDGKKSTGQVTTI